MLAKSNVIENAILALSNIRTGNTSVDRIDTPIYDSVFMFHPFRNMLIKKPDSKKCLVQKKNLWWYS